MTKRLPRRPTRRPRAGFTIIELLMVILIIGILAALLIPAIQAAMARARETEVLTEIKGLEKGILDFKGRYGVDPPSFIVLYEQGAATGNDPSWAGDSTSPAHYRASRAIIRQIWPDFDFNTLGDPSTNTNTWPGNPTAGNNSLDLNGNGTEDDVILLNGAECLVFFLGGVTEYPVALPNNPNGWAPLGFSANPQYPFARGGNRFGPFVTFDPARLVDLDPVPDGMPEFLDTLSGQELPYQYLSSYEGRGYQPYGLNNTPGDADDELGVGFGLTRIYYQSPPFLLSDPIPTNARPFNPDTFQIISPGRDFEFGSETGMGGGYYNGEGVASDRGFERDNITNFKGGRLN